VGDVFAGLDKIDWHAMEHAYGPADEVPELVRGLISADPEVREEALDGMEGAVHHQGDVYDCTLASIPFLLEAAVHPGLPGRGEILGLLASIGGAEHDRPAESGTLYRDAAEAVAAACPAFLGLLADPDPAVRRAVGQALLVCRGEAARAVAAVQKRIDVEPDLDVRIALVAALGTFGKRAKAGDLPGVAVAEVCAVLLALLTGPAHPRLRLAAVTEFARCGPARLPPDVTPTVLELLPAAYAEVVPAPEPVGFATPTLRGFLRAQAENEADVRRSPHLDGLIRKISWAFADRVDDRAALLAVQLRSSDWERRHDSLFATSDLICGWRGDYRELVLLIGDQLQDPRPQLCLRAAETLRRFDHLAEPAADALARSLETALREATRAPSSGPPAWLTIRPDYDYTETSPGLKALAGLGDIRALPMLRWLLEHEQMPKDVGALIGCLGAGAVNLLPVIVRRLRDLPTVQGYDRARSGLVAAIGEMGAAAATVVPDLIELMPITTLVGFLGRIGPGAAEAAKSLSPLLQDPEHALAAASALWRIEGDPGPVVPVFAGNLDSENYYTAHAAAMGIAEVGPDAAAHAPRLRALLDNPDEYGWRHVRAASALWRTTGDTETVVPVLAATWTKHPNCRRDIVGYLAEMGPAARSAAPLLRAELESLRRHTVRSVSEYIDVMQTDISADERLVRDSASALTAIGDA
jgi:hypothetical protein